MVLLNNRREVTKKYLLDAEDCPACSANVIVTRGVLWCAIEPNWRQR